MAGNSALRNGFATKKSYTHLGAKKNYRMGFVK
jgi:hypothetical protein